MVTNIRPNTLVSALFLIFNLYFILFKSCAVIGWTLSAIGIGQLPLWACIAVYKEEGFTVKEKILNATKPKADWGPMKPEINQRYVEYRRNTQTILKRPGIWQRMVDNIFA